MNQVIISQMNNTDKKDVIYTGIDEGINLFCHLLILPTDRLDRLTIEEIFICKQKVINVLMCYSNCNSVEKYHKCMFAISTALEKEKRLFDELDKNNFVQNILKNKKFLENQKISHFFNKIIGNYLAYKLNVSYDLLVDVIKFEIEYLNMNVNNNYYRKEIFWTLSNVVKCDENIYNEIINNEDFIKLIIDCYKNTIYHSEIKEITYLFCLLLHRCNIKQFMTVEKNNLMQIAVNYAKNVLEKNVNCFCKVMKDFFHLE